jgi:hypothetical protein
MKQGDICLVWNSESIDDLGPSGCPLVAIPDQQVRDFYSFVGTYVSSYQPFSAFFRVVTISVLVEMLRERPKIRDRVSERLVGAIIAETRSQLGLPRRELSDIPIQSCLASLSFPAVAGILHGVLDEHFSKILENWTKVRLIISDEDTPVSGIQLSRFWEIVRRAIAPSPAGRVPENYRNIAKLIFDVSNGDDDDTPAAWHGLTERLPKSRAALLRMRGSREERVRAMDVIGHEISSTKVELEVAEILLGYSASRVAGGSLRYFKILQEFEPRFPLSPVWFGLFCSIQNDTDALVIGDCLGRRIMRHLNNTRDDLFSSPTADISFDEFVNINATARPPKWRTEHQASISIEIFPGITSAFRSSSRAIPRDSNDQVPTVAVETLQEIRFLATSMLKALDTVDIPKQGRLFADVAKSALFKKPRKSER